MTVLRTPNGEKQAFSHMRTVALLAGAAVFAMTGAMAHAQSVPAEPVPYDTMIDLGTLGGTYSYPHAVSADGSVVVGQAATPDNNYAHAFVWTAQSGMVDLGTLGGDYSYARDVSADGSVIVGQSYLSGNSTGHAFRSTEAGGMVSLGTLGGSWSQAYAVSDDGSVIVGESTLTGMGNYHAFRWTQSGGMVDLGTLGGDYSYARDLSADGSVVVGQSYLAGNSGWRAFRWTQSGGMADLGSLGGDYSYATSVSADGSVVVGQSNLAGNSNNHAFRWTQADGMEDLGTLGGDYSYARRVSSDGTTIVGHAQTVGNATQHAFRWTQSGGMADLGTLGGDWAYGEDVSADGSVVVGASRLSGEDGSYRAFRWTEEDGMVDLGTLGGAYSEASAISDDGSTVVGRAQNAAGENRSFIYRTRMQDFTNMIASFGLLANDLEVATEYQRDTASWLIDRGCTMRDDQRFCIGAEGLLTLTSANLSPVIDKRKDAAAKIMVGVRLAPALTLGAGAAIVDYRNAIGAIRPKDGYSFGGWLNYAPGGASLKGIKARVSAAIADQENRIERGVGLANVDVTPGQTDIKTTVVRGELGYGIDVGSNAVITPLAGVTWQRSKMKAFDEAPGDFPASFAGQSFDTTYATAGVEFSIPASATGRFTLGGKVDFDLNSDTIGLVGTSQIPGMDAFAVPSSLKRHDVRPRVEAGYAQQVGPGVVSVNAQVATPTFGGHARFGIGIGFGVGF